MAPRSPVRIRSLRIADYDEAYEIWRNSEGVGLNESDSRGAVRRFLKRNPGLSQAAISADNVVATLLCGHDGRRGYLHHLAVAHKWRRKGVGRTLVATCLEKLHREGILKCNLFLYASNRTGKVFWTRLGWKVRADLRLVQRGTSTLPASIRKGC
jgi:putative acetyltransferase